jgi:hypothetical protein
MACYISSNANRFYTALESPYGHVGAITPSNRIPAIHLGMKQQLEVTDRKDKTGSRTFAGLPSGGRRRTTFDLKTYLTNWDKSGTSDPAYTPLFRGALGGAPQHFAGGTAGSGSSGTTLVFSSPHGLAAGQAVTFGGEIRFVSAIASSSAVVLNAPFSAAPGAGAALGRTLTIGPATGLPSVSIFDYWSPATAVQRILSGASVDRMEFRINGDFHEFSFSGLAQDVIDSSSFASGEGHLEDFPAEPALGAFDYSIVPGHMGQAWLGSTAERFLTITQATLTLDNHLQSRARDFGSDLVCGPVPGQRRVAASFDLVGRDDNSTKALYQAARQQSPIEVMFQLGEVEGQLLGVYLKSVIPEVPEFDDSENRLQWRFRESRAQGTVDDEIVVALA